MPRLLIVLVALGLVLPACGARPEVAERTVRVQATPSPSPSPSPRPTPTPTPSPPPPPAPPPTAPLTGLAADRSVLTRPVVAIKIDNAPPARPQHGLDEAAIVLEELVEGGLTRFVALYHDTQPAKVGPVRSGRDVDAHLLPAFRPVLGFAGAAPPTLAVLEQAGLRMVDGHASPAFHRDPSRRAPYNMFVDTAALSQEAAGLPPARQPWPFAGAAPAGGRPVTSAQLTFSAQASSTWAWDDASGRWLRSEGEQAHVTAAGQQVAAENVVAVLVPVQTGAGVDANGARTIDIHVLGEGDAIVLRDGQAFQARWRKAAPDAHFAWLDAAGGVLPLRPGRTWVALVPLSGRVDLA